MKETDRVDIFDKIMQLPVLNVFNPLYKKYKEILLYILFGGISFVLNIGLFAAIDVGLHLNELINNIICWIVCVLFQFFTNRTWVFDGKVNSRAAFLKQMSGFFGGRIFTLIVEEAILLVFVTWLKLKAVLVKLVAQIVVIILNYVISKCLVFKKK